MTSVSLAQPAKPLHTAPPRVLCHVEELPEGHPPSQESWLRLLESAAHSRVYHHPGYAAAALPDLNTSAWTIVCETDGELSTMAIFIPKRLPFGRQLLPGASSSLVGVRLAGFDLLGNQDERIVAAIVDRLADEIQRRSIPVVEFEEIEEDSLLWRQLQQLKRRGFRFVPASDFDAHRRIQLPQTIDEYWGSFKSKSRSTLRKKRRKLGDYRVQRFTESCDVDALLEAAHAVSLHTWQTYQLGLRVRADEREARYFRFLAEQGALRSYVLFREQQPVAFILSHQWKGTFHYDELGFDRRLVHLSPGNVLLQEAIDDLLTYQRPEVLDFGLGDADYKRLFANQQSRSATIRMFAPGPHGLWQTMSMNLRRNLVRSARYLAAQTGIATRLRRILRDRAAS